jgi:hypothetical protein
MGGAIVGEHQLRSLVRIVTTLCIFVAMFSDGVAGNKMTNLPGGVKCADLFNNAQPICFFEIQIGRISAGTPADVRYLLDHRVFYPQKIWGSGVYLNSLGGDVAAAIEIGKLIRDQKLPAIIDSSEKCVSACVFVLAGAIQRKIRGAVGIHRPYFATMGNANSPDGVILEYRGLLKQARDYLTNMGVAARLLDEMLRIEPDDVRYLTRTELDSYRLGEGPPGDDIESVASLKEAVIVKTAAAYGLSRQEYHRRSALISRTCEFNHYQSPFEADDPSAYGRSLEEMQMSKRELLAHDLETEERGWAHCYKMIMTHGR